VSTVNADTTNESAIGTARVKRGMAEMLKGGVIMDVVTPDQAKIAEDAGAVAVMALERVPADIRAQGGVARMSDPDMIDGIIAAVSIPVMAKCRIGHFAEAQVLQAIGVDYIDESEVLTPADEAHHVDKWKFTVPFVCGATNLGEALRRLAEGAAMIRSKGEAGTGNVVEATRHMRSIRSEIARLSGLPSEELFTAAKELGAPRYEVALALESAALAELRARRPDRVLETNVEFWAAIVLDFAEVPAHMFTSMFTCARTAGWAAHILEQKRTGRLVRPSARYIGPKARSVSDVPGAAEVLDKDV